MKLTAKTLVFLLPILTTACGDIESPVNETDSASHNATESMTTGNTTNTETAPEVTMTIKSFSDVPKKPVSEFDRIKNLPSTYRGRPQVTNNHQNVQMGIGPCVEVFSWMSAYMKADDCVRVSAPQGILFAVSQCVTYIPADEIGRLCQDLRFNGDMAKMGEAYMYGYAAALYLEAAQNR